MATSHNGLNGPWKASNENHTTNNERITKALHAADTILKRGVDQIASTSDELEAALIAIAEVRRRGSETQAAAFARLVVERDHDAESAPRQSTPFEFPNRAETLTIGA